MKSAPHKGKGLTGHIEPLILIFLLLSGTCGLIYEILWMKMLTLVIGNTVFSITTVLTAFMAGLALGSFLAGRLIDRIRNPLKVYGLLEVGIGVFALLLPILIVRTEPFFRLIYRNADLSFYAFSLLRFVICGAILLIPTTLMGATLPVLSKFFVHRSTHLGRNVAKLYGVNTFGAVLGSFSAGFILIPILGITRTIYGAALLNLFIGASVLILSRRRARLMPSGGEERSEDAERERKSGRAARGVQAGRRAVVLVVMIGIGISGLAAMIYQVAWTRVLSLSIGTSIYAFSLIVTTFICGLALGSVVIAKFIDRRRNLILALALMEGAIGISAMLIVPILGKLPIFIAEVVLESNSSFRNIQLMEFAIIFPLILIPTFMMGAAVPTAIKICTPDARRVGRFFGNVYAANTLGAIIGSFVVGFLLLPWLGTQKSIMTAVAMNTIVAGVLFLHAAPLSLRRRLAGALVTLALVLAAWRAIPPWDTFVLSSGLYLYADLYKKIMIRENVGLEEAVKLGGQLLFFEEGLHAVVAVAKNYYSEGDLHLLINGKADATAMSDAATQLLLGHLPLLLHRDAGEVLVIGLGSGMTLGAVERYPVEAVDVVEIEMAVVRASEYFREFTGDALYDERADLLVADARNHLTLTDRNYDIIISEPSNPWISGIANLFSREFFELAKQRLREDGIMCQWVHAYAMFPADFKTILHTFQSVFPHATLWEAAFGGDYLLIGSRDGLNIDYETLQSRLSDEEIRADLRNMQITDLASLIRKLLMVEHTIAQYSQGAPLHTDDNSRLEYSAPKALIESWDTQLLEEILRDRSSPAQVLSSLSLAEMPASIESDLKNMFQARKYILEGRLLQAKGELPEALAKFESALSFRPRDYEANYLLAKVRCEMGEQLMDAQRWPEAVDAYEEGIRTIDDFFADESTAFVHDADFDKLSAKAYLNLGLMAMSTNKLEEAERALQQSLAGEVRIAQAHTNLGVVYARSGRYEEAEEQWQQALSLNPDLVPAHMNLGNLRLQQRRFGEAVENFGHVKKLRPDFAVANYSLGVAYFELGEWAKAEREWKRALKLDPHFSDAQRGLNLVRQQMQRR